MADSIRVAQPIRRHHLQSLSSTGGGGGGAYARFGGKSVKSLECGTMIEVLVALR